MTEIPDLTHGGQSQVSVGVDKNDELIMPDVNRPPTWLTVKAINRLSVNIGHENGERGCGFDLTNFESPENFVKMLESIDVDPYYGYVRVDISRWDEETRYYYVWGNENGMIVCGNNPITGEYSSPDDRHNDPGYGSYIGVEGTKGFVDNAYQMIIQYGNYKDVDRQYRSFI